MPLDPDSDAPSPRFLERKSTLAIPKADRFDCWRAWHPTVSLIRLSEFPAATGCSRAHLYRAFARRGTTFANVLRDVRLNKAKALLLDPRPRSIAQVSGVTGYADQSSFSRVFHAAVGVTPRDWRRAHLHSPQLTR